MDEPGSLATAPLRPQDVTAPPGVPGRPSGTRSGTLPVGDAPQGPAPSGLLTGVQTVGEQLRRLESRLVAEAGEDPAGQREVRRLVALSRARFRGARIQTFLPILIERDVRRRLSAGRGGLPVPRSELRPRPVGPGQRPLGLPAS